MSLSFSAKNLPNLGTFKCTGFIVELYEHYKGYRSEKWIKLGETEVIMDDSNPAWINNFDVEYNFVQQRRYKIEIWDISDNSSSVDRLIHELIDRIEFNIHEVVTAKN